MRGGGAGSPLPAMERGLMGDLARLPGGGAGSHPPAMRGGSDRLLDATNELGGRR